MKKLSVILLLLTTLFLLSGCADSIDDGNWTYGYQRFPEKCFVISYHWDGDPENMEITIPDEFRGVKITSLGGMIGRGYSCPFTIRLPEEYEYPSNKPGVFSTTDIGSASDSEYETLSFTLILGDNLTEAYEPVKTRYIVSEDPKTGQLDILYKIEYLFSNGSASPHTP